MSFRQGFLYICLFVCWLITLFLLPLFPKLVWAANEDSLASCQPIYGGGESCLQTRNIIINKTVQNPQTLQYVDNLGIDDPKYYPGQVVQFRITVTNASNTPIKNIEVKDRLPQYIENATKIITYRIDNLNKNESKTFTVKEKVASKSNLPENNETICLVNQAVATQMQQTSQDNSQFCIQKNEASSATAKPLNPSNTKGGLPVYPPSKTKATPSTGPDVLALTGLFASVLFGFMLRKKKVKPLK